MSETEEKKASPNRVRPDLATLGGLVVAIAGLLGGLFLEKGSLLDVAQGTAAMIVLGGTLGAVLVTTPRDVLLRAFRGLGAVFFERPGASREMAEKLVRCATKARKYGIVSLERDAAEAEDPFLAKALGLATDGAGLEELRNIIESDINLAEIAAEAEARVWESAGGYAPTIGILGAVMGLIQVMKRLEDIREVGHGIAVAFVATVYGVGLANLFFLPAAQKLRARMHAATMARDMILEGVVGIVEGMNPTLIRIKLEAYYTAPAIRNRETQAAGKARSGATEPAAVSLP